MARVLALLASGRTKGFTGGLLEAAARGAEGVEDVEVERVHLHQYRFGPCRSCFSCIRSEAHECSQQDDMGGKGRLLAKLKTANGWLLADPVHMWGPSAQTHLFMERCYPFLWSGALCGMPFASISCASNQGMQRLANATVCKWAFCYGLRYVGGMPVHTAYLERAMREAEELGRQLGLAALRDGQGRTAFTDQERYLEYLDKPWSALEPYLQNLSNGTMEYSSSLVAEGLVNFKRREAIELLEQASGVFQEALELYKAGRLEDACERLVSASALWTHATWKEFLEEEVIKTSAPQAYRPLAQ